MPMAESGGVDDHVAAVVPGREVGHKSRIAHEVGEVLRQIAFRVDTELAGRRLVAPFNAALLVEQHHAIGRRLDGGEEFLQPVFGLPGLLLAVAQQLADALGQLTPHAGPARRQAGGIVAQHPHQPLGAPSVKPQPEYRTQPGAQPPELPSKNDDSARSY